ncbi:hypothetical protein CPT_Shady_059 [Streptomyces phage Shady]|uniref:Uncharacterized protein n=1 Tax=Streptomyces phage Shady TaxID=2767585 RepID=A0A873WEH3_9CAUD|nr:hypothetical protein CPT_Shady_059 [Streptomyces phage Shady]
MNATVSFSNCVCNNGRMSDLCPADRRDAGLHFYRRELDAFAALVKVGRATLADIENAEALSAEWGKLLNREVSCLSAA